VTAVVGTALRGTKGGEGGTQEEVEEEEGKRRGLGRGRREEWEGKPPRFCTKVRAREGGKKEGGRDGGREGKRVLLTSLLGLPPGQAESCTRIWSGW
jgi:hypothetical protein